MPNTLSKISLYLLCLSAFILPFNSPLAHYSIGLYALSAIAENIVSRSFSFPKGKIFWLGIAFFAMHLISVIYSDNQKVAWFDIEVKLPLIVFPFIFMFTNPFLLKHKKYVLYSFMAGSFICSFFLLQKGFSQYAELGGAAFFYDAIALFHPSYQALYFSFALISSLSFIIQGQYKTKIKLAFGFLSLYFSTIIFLLQSKGGLLSILLIALFLSIYFVSKIQSLFYKIGIIGIFVIGASIFATKSYRIASMSSDIKLYLEASEEEQFKDPSSTSLRINIWRSILQEAQHIGLTGVGAGDIKPLLFRKYKENKMDYALEIQLNSHNQYLETFVGQGLIGLLLLILLLVSSFVESIKQKDILKTMFLILIFSSFIPEAMLNLSAGTFFFGFMFYFFFGLGSEQEAIEKKTLSSS